MGIEVVVPRLIYQCSSRLLPVESVDILGPDIFEYKRGIIRAETKPRADVARSRKVRQIPNLLHLAVGDPHSQHSRTVQPSQEVNILSVS